MNCQQKQREKNINGRMDPDVANKTISRYLYPQTESIIRFSIINDFPLKFR